jgi:hypothetical protein
MPKVMTRATALQWALAAASRLQNVPSNDLDAEDWQDIADDLRAVADYAQAKANAAAEAEGEV